MVKASALVLILVSCACMAQTEPRAARVLLEKTSQHCVELQSRIADALRTKKAAPSLVFCDHDGDPSLPKPGAGYNRASDSAAQPEPGNTYAAHPRPRSRLRALATMGPGS